VELSKYVGFCLEDGRKFRLNEVFEIEVNVVWIYSLSRILQDLFTSMMERSMPGNKKASTLFVPSRYINQSLVWGIISLIKQTNPIVQTYPEPARLQIVVSGNRPDKCRRSVLCNVVHHHHWLEGWNNPEEICRPSLKSSELYIS
jgi:hypothetical protein